MRAGYRRFAGARTASERSALNLLTLFGGRLLVRFFGHILLIDIRVGIVRGRNFVRLFVRDLLRVLLLILGWELGNLRLGHDENLTASAESDKLSKAS